MFIHTNNTDCGSIVEKLPTYLQKVFSIAWKNDMKIKWIIIGVCKRKGMRENCCMHILYVPASFRELCEHQ